MSARLRLSLASLLLVAMLAASPAHAYFDDVSTGARAEGMGTAGMAMIDDVSAFAWNPSALDRLDRNQAFVAYGRPLGVGGLYAGSVAYGGRVPGLKGLGLAVAWRRYGVSDVYAEDLWQVSVGQTVRRFDSGHALALGGSLKAGRIGVATYDDPIDGTAVDFGSRSAVSFDTAVGWRTPWNLDFAWTTTDWNRPDFGFIAGSSGTEVASSHRFGVAFRWNPESTVGVAWTSPDGEIPSRFDVGVEIEFFNVFAIRSALTDLGGLPDPGTSAQRFQYAGGVGLLNDRWNLDAAVATNRDLGTSYRFSLVVPFGGALRKGDQ